jgi:hypothetical protein
VVADALPVSGIRIHVRELTGQDQLLLLHPPAGPLETLVTLLRRAAVDAGGREIAWGELPAVDLAAGALLIRGAWLGELIHTETVCPSGACAQLVDVSFRIRDYLAHHAPRRHRGVVAREDGWLGLPGGDISFRVPTIDDVMTADREDRDGDWLASRCVRPAGVPASVQARVDRALAAIAPRLDDHLAGECSHCGSRLELLFDPIHYVLTELRQASSDLYADIHEVALAYHWPEASIMALDRRRRHAYVELLRGETVLG